MSNEWTQHDNFCYKSQGNLLTKVIPLSEGEFICVMDDMYEVRSVICGTKSDAMYIADQYLKNNETSGEVVEIDWDLWSDDWYPEDDQNSMLQL